MNQPASTTGTSRKMAVETRSATAENRAVMPAATPITVRRARRMSRVSAAYSSVGIWLVSHRSPHDSQIHFAPSSSLVRSPQRQATVTRGSGTVRV